MTPRKSSSYYPYYARCHTQSQSLFHSNRPNSPKPRPSPTSKRKLPVGDAGGEQEATLSLLRHGGLFGGVTAQLSRAECAAVELDLVDLPLEKGAVARVEVADAQV